MLISSSGRLSDLQTHHCIFDYAVSCRPYQHPGAFDLSLCQLRPPYLSLSLPLQIYLRAFSFRFFLHVCFCLFSIASRSLCIPVVTLPSDSSSSVHEARHTLHTIARHGHFSCSLPTDIDRVACSLLLAELFSAFFPNSSGAPSFLVAPLLISLTSSTSLLARAPLVASPVRLAAPMWHQPRRRIT